MNGRYFLALGAIYGFLAVVLGAVGAHALKPHATEDVMTIYRTAETYNFYHALALVAVGVFALYKPSLPLTISGVCFAIGVLLFCGSLYLMALKGAPANLAPFGGVLLMLGWLTLCWSALRAA